MQVITIIDSLRRHPILVAMAFALSVVIGVLAAFQVTPGLPPKLTSRRHHTGEATARILVNTPSSIVADLNPAGGASLTDHAQLLGDLVDSDPIRDSIAVQAGISPGSLAVQPPSVGGDIPTELATQAPAAAGAAKLTVTVDPVLPIVSIQAQAATPVLAAALANDTVAVLKSYVQNVAVSERIRVSQRAVVTQLGDAQGLPAEQGTPPIAGLVVALMSFCFACLGIVCAAGMRARLREARAVTNAPGRSPAPPDLEPAGGPLRRPMGPRSMWRTVSSRGSSASVSRSSSTSVLDRRESEPRQPGNGTGTPVPSHVLSDQIVARSSNDPATP